MYRQGELLIKQVIFLFWFMENITKSDTKYKFLHNVKPHNPFSLSPMVKYVHIGKKLRNISSYFCTVILVFYAVKFRLGMPSYTFSGYEWQVKYPLTAV